MFLVLGGVLNRHEVAALREAASALEFCDGRATAGRHAKLVKHNEQAEASADLETIFAKVRANLAANGLFNSAARPRHFARMLLARYTPGMEYGLHVDDALIGGYRTDLSFTLFLSEEDSYEGGGLVVEDALESREIRLGAGDMVLYPSATLHRVDPVARGERLAVVGWIQSWIRDPRQREILFDLDQSVNEVFERDGKTTLFDRLAKTRSNLLRMWAES